MCNHTKSLFLLCLMALFLLPLCDKDKNNAIHIEGKIYDPNSVSFVSGASVTIAASKLSSGGIFSSGYEDIGTTTSDGDGTFIFDFTEEKFGGYQIRVEKSQYYSTVKDVATSEITPGITFSPTYNIYPVCHINLKIRNAVPFDTNDYVFYSFTSGYLNGSGCCGNTMMEGHGLYYSDSILCKTHGNQNVTLTYNVRKDGTIVIHTKTLYCNAFDTTYFNIDY